MPGEPGTTTLVVANRVAPPYELERILVTVDGRTLPVSSVPPSGTPAALLARVHLPPGEHELALMGTARQRPDASDHVAVARTEETLRIGVAPALVALDLSMHPGDDGLRIAIRVEAGAAKEVAGAQKPEDAACRHQPPLRRALCRAEVRLGDAEHRSDPAYFFCVRDKLVALRELADIVSPEPRPGPAAVPPSEEQDLRSEASRSAQERIATLERELDGCSPHDDSVP